MIKKYIEDKKKMEETIATITEDYVSFETAKLLKEKGFLKAIDLRMTQNLSFYDNIGLSHNLNKYYDSLIQDKIDFVIAPTLQMAIKWLRDVHNLFVFPFPQINTNKFWTEIYQLSDNQQWENLYCKSIDLQDYLTYETACEAAIKYCLTNLI